jgi:hypothetical protein
LSAGVAWNYQKFPTPIFDYHQTTVAQLLIEYRTTLLSLRYLNIHSKFQQNFFNKAKDLQFTSHFGMRVM